MSSIGEVGQAIGPGYCRSEAVGGVISEAVPSQTSGKTLLASNQLHTSNLGPVVQRAADAADGYWHSSANRRLSRAIIRSSRV